MLNFVSRFRCRGSTQNTLFFHIKSISQRDRSTQGVDRRFKEGFIPGLKVAEVEFSVEFPKISLCRMFVDDDRAPSLRVGLRRLAGRATLIGRGGTT